jgi:hypothetical protein
VLPPPPAWIWPANSLMDFPKRMLMASLDTVFPLWASGSTLAVRHTRRRIRP